MANLRRELFDSQKLRSESTGPIKVLVSLTLAADSKCVAGLERIGLRVKEVSGNKVIGEILAEHLGALNGSEGVAQVERAVTLKPTKA